MCAAPSPPKIKTCIRQLYERLAIAGTANLSRAPILRGEKLALALGYDTAQLPNLNQAWELFAGCGNPLEMVSVDPEWTVVDLGCGAGLDCQMAALSLLPEGMAIGIDITVELLRIAKKYGSKNPRLQCHWLAGDGEFLPLQRESVHLVVANGSFNLMPNKEQALTEVCRVLRPGGYLALADLIRVGEMEPITDGLEEAWTWCVAGALSPDEYGDLLKSSGFFRWELSSKCSYGPLTAAHLLAQKALTA
ncbi:MAG: methyltransferase domain-containing protein [Deltaproteobacteria bacterium]|nr:MAG: methyltransferase domain-containing protein [Deltaproteobacteria bacterium]